jgi:hypothetical protein
MQLCRTVPVLRVVRGGAAGAFVDLLVRERGGVDAGGLVASVAQRRGEVLALRDAWVEGSRRRREARDRATLEPRPWPDSIAAISSGLSEAAAA